MLETLISSKTRINLLIRFFLNLARKSHLRGIANDFKESTNSIRLELNSLTKAGYLLKKKENNKVNYLANATIICGNKIGKYSFIGAGSVITKDVPDFALMVGKPAKQIGWMSASGNRLNFGIKDKAICPESG